MSIGALQARIADNQRRIGVLEQECLLLERKIERMYDEEAEHRKNASRFRNLLEAEQQNITSIQAVENMRIAEQCAQDINGVLSGSKAQGAVAALEQISATFVRRINESEADLRDKRAEISRLHSDIAFCRQEISRLEEEARREAARRAARDA